MALEWFVAQDTFVADVDGAPMAVTKGATLPNTHPLVKLDAGRNKLFLPQDTGTPEPPPPPRKGKAT